MKLPGRFSFLRCCKGFRLSVLLEGPGCSCTAEVERVVPEEQAPSPALFQPLHGRVQGEAWRVGSCFSRCVPTSLSCFSSFSASSVAPPTTSTTTRLSPTQLNLRQKCNVLNSTQLNLAQLNPTRFKVSSTKHGSTKLMPT